LKNECNHFTISTIGVCFVDDLFFIFALEKKNISDKFFFSWLIIFVVFVFLAMFPKILEPLMKELFIIRVMDLGMIGTFMILTYVTIENNIKIKNLESKMEKLTRKIAIEKIKKDK